MQTEELIDLAGDKKRLKAESQNIELVAAAGGCPTRLFDTLSAFSNQDGGGIIIFGIEESADYAVCGVYDAQDLQKKVNEQCKQMEPVIRPLFTICEIDGKEVVSAEIPGADISDRPVFYKGTGRIRGSFVRVGESDEPMSEYEVYSYEAFRKRIKDDIRTVEETTTILWDEERINEYLSAVKSGRKNLSENVSDAEILELMGVTRNGEPTLSGIMTFSRYPQSVFTQLCITAVVYPGTQQERVVGDDGARFIDNKRITGPIPDMLEEAVEFVRKNCRLKTIIGEDGRRADKYEYPIKAVREAILNALIHRDYSIHSENIPVSIEMYHDRLEIKNSGGLYGRITIDSLGKVRPETRNPELTNILELLQLTENRYSGIPTMRSECINAGIPLPDFSVSHGEFKVTFRNSYDQSGSDSDAIVDFCSTPRSRDEIVKFSGKSRNYVMSKLVAPLVEEGKLEMTLPDTPKSSKQRFISTGKK